MLTDHKQITNGLLGADKKRMIRDLVKPIKVVIRRLQHLPWFPSHQDPVEEVLEELREITGELLAELEYFNLSQEQIRKEEI